MVQARSQDSDTSILVSMVLDEESRYIRGIDPFYLSGNIDILVNDTFIRVGLYEGAVLLLLAVGAFADAVTKLRKGHRTVEVVLVLDSASLWLLEPRKAIGNRIVLAYRDIRTAPVRRENFDNACEDAAYAFIKNLIAHLDSSDWSRPLLDTLDQIGAVWPSTAQLWERFGKSE